MKIFLTKSELQECIDGQNKLNEHYSGVDWKTKIPAYKFRAAFYAEMGEFLESYTTDWKWWKPPVEDMQNARIEVVDLFHFALSILMIESGFQIKDGIVSLLKTKEEYMERIIKNTSFQNIESFMTLFYDLTSYTDMSKEQFLDLYRQKMKLNEERVNKGYKEGKYNKIDENGNEDNRKLNI